MRKLSIWQTAILEAKKRGLFDNINRRRKLGKSRKPSDSTIDPKTYKQMRDW